MTPSRQINDRRYQDIAQIEARLEKHLEEYAAREAKQDLMQAANMQAIAELTTATAAVVDAWKVANGFQRFIKWLSGFAVLGASITWAAKTFP